MAKGLPILIAMIERDRRPQRTCPVCAGFIQRMGRLKRGDVLGEYVGQCLCGRGLITWLFDVGGMRWKGDLTERGIREQVVKEERASAAAWARDVPYFAKGH